MNVPFPGEFFKYREINSYTKKIFTHCELYFPSVEELNDPFDGQLSLRNYVEDLDPAAAEIICTSDDYLKYVSDLERMGVLCMSRNCDNIQMWSHYANGHKGLCLGFRGNLGDHFSEYSVEQHKFLELLKQICDGCSKDNTEECLDCPITKEKKKLEWEIREPELVNYCTEYPFKDLCNQIGSEMQSDPDIAHDFILSIQAERINRIAKDIHWKYEEEIRFVAPTSGARKFHPTALSKVIFGIKTSDEDKKMILDLLEDEMWKHVAVFDLRKVKKKIKLEANEVLRWGN